MKVGITGARGYVGSHLARHLEAQGHEVAPISREQGFRLGATIRPEMIAGLDALVHAAYDFSARKWAEHEASNIRGSVELFDVAAAAGVRRLLFVSSMAAFDGCRSLYGRSKLAVESHVLGLGGYVVRPGTVFGGELGGLLRSLNNLVARLPIVPIPGDGDQVLYMIHIDDLSDVLRRTLDVDLPRPLRLISAACPEGLTFREVLSRIARSQGLKRPFLSIPPALLLASLRAAEAVLGSSSPVRRDSFVSLLNQNSCPDLSLPVALGAARPRPFEIE
jgi:nucleoside-diphosphate-sugar epimerase